MSINVHKTGLSKTLGQQSDAIVTAGLVGHWDPGVGVETLYWDNQVSGGNNLRRFNGIAHSTFWSFDGTDDYLGEASSGYGGSAFTINAANAFTVSTWARAGNGDSNILFQIADGALVERVTCTLSPGTNDSNHYSSVYFTVASDENSVSESVYAPYCNSQDCTESMYPLINDTWYFITVTHDGSGNYKVFVNGTIMNNGQSGNDMKTTFDFGVIDDVAQEFRIGYDAYGSYYSDSSSMLGHVLVYTAELTNSQIRQNFLATHKVNSDRYYGATYTA
ncbi:hypothetical protein CL634_11400 [bacterium]|nr:hypothetical protein [bacterium]